LYSASPLFMQPILHRACDSKLSPGTEPQAFTLALSRFAYSVSIHRHAVT